MNTIEKALLPIALLAAVAGCKDNRPMVEACLPGGERSDLVLEIHTAINSAETRYRQQQGRERQVLILGDLLQETQTCSVNRLREIVIIFEFAYRETGDGHFARQRDIVQMLVDIRRFENSRESQPEIAIEDTI